MPKVSNTDLRFPELGWGGSTKSRQQATEGCIGGHDHGAAQAYLASIENHRLARRDGALRYIKT
jgi:hypothetical protein